MSYRIVVHPAVADELEEAYQWIAKDAPANAVHWYNQMVDVVQTLKDFPNRCPPAPEQEYADEDFRHLIQGNYRIIFVVRSDEVHILHVRHAARRAIGEQGDEQV